MRFDSESNSSTWLKRCESIRTSVAHSIHQVSRALRRGLLHVVWSRLISALGERAAHRFARSTRRLSCSAPCLLRLDRRNGLGEWADMRTIGPRCAGGEPLVRLEKWQTISIWRVSALLWYDRSQTVSFGDAERIGRRGIEPVRFIRYIRSRRTGRSDAAPDRLAAGIEDALIRLTIESRHLRHGVLAVRSLWL